MQPEETDEPQAGASEPASFLVRAAAFSVDLVVIHLAYLGCFVAAFALGWPDPHRNWLTLSFRLPMILLLFGAGFPFFAGAYFWALHAWQGQTVGKMLFGIRVVTGENEVPPYGQIFLRCIGYCVSLLPCGLGFFWCAVDRENRCFHDHLAATWVVTNADPHRQRPAPLTSGEFPV